MYDDDRQTTLTVSLTTSVHFGLSMQRGVISRFYFQRPARFVCAELKGNPRVALILIADDDELVVELVRDALGAHGHVVGAVDDGAPVMGILRTKKPELLILDCTMPETSGIEVLRLVRNSPEHYDLPILMLTGRRSEQDEQLAMRSGANDYLRKPFDVDLLVIRVEALLAKARRPDHAAAGQYEAKPRERRWGVR